MWSCINQMRNLPASQKLHYVLRIYRVVKVKYVNTGMRGITTFRSTTNCIYDGGLLF